MKIEFYILLVTVFLMYNSYYDNYYSNMLTINQKYIKIIGYGCMGFSLFIFFRKNPGDKPGMVSLLNDIVKYMPIDKDTSNLFFDLSNLGSKKVSTNFLNSEHLINDTKIINSGTLPVQNNSGSTKRSVSETKKKYIASNQHWKCAKCRSMLDATFEIDHIVDLEYGGDNSVHNLRAMCRNCHGQKTMQKYL
jgi:hypothetical protein